MWITCAFTKKQCNIVAYGAKTTPILPTRPNAKSSMKHNVSCCFIVSRDVIQRLLAVVLVGNGQLLAAMSAARSQHTTTILGGHSLTEAMLVHTTTIVGLECSFHFVVILIVYDT